LSKNLYSFHHPKGEFQNRQRSSGSDALWPKSLSQIGSSKFGAQSDSDMTVENQESNTQWNWLRADVSSVQIKEQWGSLGMLL
jgi:hypothetical protein